MSTDAAEPPAYRKITDSLYSEQPRVWKDKVGIGLFIGVTLFTLIYFSIEWTNYFADGIEFDPISSLLITILCVAAVLGVAFGIMWLGCLFLMQGISCKVSVGLWVGMNVGFGIYMLATEPELLKFNAITMFVIAGLSCVWFVCVRHKFPFAQLCMDISMKAFAANKGVLAVAAGSVFINVGWLIMENLFFVVLVATAALNGNVKTGKYFSILALVFLTNSFFSNAVGFISHMTTCGAVASYLLTDNTKGATGLSLKRACTTSLGSAGYGALVITICDLIRLVFEYLFNSPCLRCLLNWFKNIVKYFSGYAFVHVAVFGDSFMQGARSTVTLFKKSGIEVVVNDSITTRTIIVGAWLCGLLTGTIGAAWYSGEIVEAAGIGSSGNFLTGNFFIYLMFWVCFSIAKSTSMSMLQVIFSSVATVFVVWAEDPAGLEANRPDFYRALTAEGESVFKFKVARPDAVAGAEEVPMAQPVAEAVPMATAMPVDDTTA